MSNNHEVWLPVVGYGGSYEVSNLGAVRSLTRTTYMIIRGAPFRRKIQGTVLKQGLYGTKGNYFYVVLWESGKHESKAVHVAVCEAFHGLRTNGMEVNHRDGITTNNCETNLEWKTPSGNMFHAADLGLIACGEKSHLAKLTEDEVRDVRRLRSIGMLQRKIGELFGIQQSQVSRIEHRQKWRNLK